MRSLAYNFDFLFRMRVPMMEEGSASLQLKPLAKSTSILQAVSTRVPVLTVSILI